LRVGSYQDKGNDWVGCHREPQVFEQGIRCEVGRGGITMTMLFALTVSGLCFAMLLNTVFSLDDERGKRNYMLLFMLAVVVLTNVVLHQIGVFSV
jgi:hypothetical protein